MTNTTISTITTEFRSGPTRTFFDTTVPISTTVTVRRHSIAGEYWSEFTKYHDPSGIIEEIKFVSKKNGIISGHHYGKHHFKYSATPSLQERAYSKLPGTTIKQLYNKHDMPPMSKIDYLNYITAILNSRSSTATMREKNLAARQLMNEIRNGEATGINPDFTIPRR
jgi:hypothetical protein